MNKKITTAVEKLDQIQESAARRDYACTLTIDNVELLMSATHCEYTGVEFSTGDYSLTFDRVDNTKGYIPGNVVPVSKIANQLKSDFDIIGMKSQANNLKRRLNGQRNELQSRIVNRKTRIKNKEIQLEQLQQGIARDRELLLQAETEAIALTETIQRDHMMAAVLKQIVTTLEGSDAHGDKYLTPWQQWKIKARARFNTFRAWFAH